MSVFVFDADTDIDQSPGSFCLPGLLQVELGAAGIPTDSVLKEEEVLTITTTNTETLAAVTAVVNAHTGQEVEVEDDPQASPGVPSGSTGYQLGAVHIDTNTGKPYILTDVAAGTWVAVGVTAHDELSGLGDNDHTQYEQTANRNANNGYAGLDSAGKLPASLIPAVALPEVHVVADSAARLALTVQEGDEAKQTDDGSMWIYDGSAWIQRQGGVAPHASTHSQGQSDEVQVQNLGATGTSGHVLTADGSGGADFQAITFPPTFPQYIDHDVGPAELLSTSTTGTTAVELDLTGLVAGLYRVAWSYQWSGNSTSRDFMAKLALDGDFVTPIMSHRQEPQDSSGTGGSSGTDQRALASGFAYVTLTAGSHDFDLQFRSSQNNIVVGIYNSNLELWRIS